MTDESPGEATEAKVSKKPRGSKAQAAPAATPPRTDLPEEQLGRLLSRLNHPVNVSYGDEHVRVPARGATNSGLIRGKLGPPPPGVVFLAAKN